MYRPLSLDYFDDEGNCDDFKATAVTEEKEDDY